jgi:tetratricopeptide (TPR) repeat protein
VRLELAKVFVQIEQYPAAKKHFEKLVNSPLSSAELSFTVALLALETGDDIMAEQFLNQSLERKYYNPDQVNMYLARIYAQRQNIDKVINFVEKISTGPLFVDSRIFAAQAIKVEKGIDQAIEYLDQYKSLDRQEKLKFFTAKNIFLVQRQPVPKSYKLDA